MTPAVGLSPKQLTFMRESSARVNILEGSIRSGKTVVSLLRWMMFVAAAPAGGELVMVGRTRDAVFRNVIKPMQEWALFGEVSRLVAYTNGAPTATILGRTVHVMGASDAKAEKVLRGMTVAGAYVDEVTVIPEEFFTQLIGRMSVRGAQLFGTTNPDGPAHWLKRKFLDRMATLPNWRSWHFTLDDNPGISAARKLDYHTEFTGLWYRRFIKGEWVAAEGAVYAGWDPDTMVLPHEKLPPLRRLLALGLDHGMTNPSAGILLGLGMDFKLYAVDEWYLDGATLQGGLTVAAQSEHLREWLGDRHPEFVVVDPAAAAFRLQLFSDGLARTQSADNDVAYGIPKVASLLGTGGLRISDRCTNLIREIPGYVWDPKWTTKGEDKPIKVADHVLDALRYSVVTTEQLWSSQLAA